MWYFLFHLHHKYKKMYFFVLKFTYVRQEIFVTATWHNILQSKAKSERLFECMNFLFTWCRLQSINVFSRGHHSFPEQQPCRWSEALSNTKPPDTWQSLKSSKCQQPRFNLSLMLAAVQQWTSNKVSSVNELSLQPRHHKAINHRWAFWLCFSGLFPSSVDSVKLLQSFVFGTKLQSSFSRYNQTRCHTALVLICKTITLPSPREAISS